MNDAERKVLIQEIKRYARVNNYNSEGKITDHHLKLMGEAEYIFRFSAERKIILINNEYVLLGNLLYYYIKEGNLDEKVLETMRACDERVVHDAYI